VETEDQQVERIKEFWHEHGKGIVVGAILGFGLFYGWRYYDASVTAAKEATSDRFNQVTELLQNNEAGAAEAAQEFLQANQENTYAHLAALELAKQAVDKGDYATAVTALQVVRDHADANLRAIADIRQARILLQQDQYDAALSALNTEKPEAFTVTVAELRGDVLVEQGDIEGARAAYQVAADGASGSSTNTATIKLQNLAVSS